MKRWKSLTAALCAAVLLCGFSAVPAFAYADGGEGENYGDPTMTEETTAPEPEPTIEPGEGFSEEGNRRRAGTPFTLSLTMTSLWTRRASSMKPTF